MTRGGIHPANQQLLVLRLTKVQWLNGQMAIVRMPGRRLAVMEAHCAGRDLGQNCAGVSR